MSDVPVFESDIHKSAPIAALVAGAATIELDLPNRIPAHWVLIAEFFTSAAGTTPATPTSGTATYTAQLAIRPGVYLPITNGVVDFAVAERAVNWLGGSVKARVICASIAGGGATHVRLTAQGSRS